MKTRQIIICVIVLILGMLIASMLTNVCGCKTKREGFTGFQFNQENDLTPEEKLKLLSSCSETSNDGEPNHCQGGILSAYTRQGDEKCGVNNGVDMDFCEFINNESNFVSGNPPDRWDSQDNPYENCNTSLWTAITMPETNLNLIKRACRPAQSAAPPVLAPPGALPANAGAGTNCVRPSSVTSTKYGITENLNKNTFDVTLECNTGYSTASPREGAWVDPGTNPTAEECAEGGGVYTVTNPCECVDRRDVERAALGQEPECPSWALSGGCTREEEPGKDTAGHDVGGIVWMNRNCAKSCSQCVPVSTLGADGEDRLTNIQAMVGQLCSAGAGADPSVGNCTSPFVADLTSERECATNPCQPVDYGDANSSCCKNQCDWSDENYKEAKASGECGCPDNTWKQCCTKDQMLAHFSADETALPSDCAPCLYPDGEPVQCIEP
jgi:hypothetical protein